MAGNILIGRINKDKADSAKKKMDRALALDGKNLAALYNAGVMNKDFKYKLQLAGVMMVNQYNLFSEKPLLVINPEVNKPSAKPNSKSVNAIKGSETIRVAVLGLAGDSYYQEDYETSVKLNDLLLKAGYSYNGYVEGMKAKALIELGCDDEARTLAKKIDAIRYADSFPKELKADFDRTFDCIAEEFYAQDIITGKITAANIKEFKRESVLISGILDAHKVGIKYIGLFERIKDWVGCGDFIESLDNLSAWEKTDFCN